MKAGSRVKTAENSGFIGRGGLLRVACRAKMFPSNLADISLKHRKTKAFRSSRATDIHRPGVEIHHYRYLNIIDDYSRNPDPCYVANYNI